MSHLDICSTRYRKKKGRESNWQFDSQPLKVGFLGITKGGAMANATTKIKIKISHLKSKTLNFQM
jgi:hypothetical protein